VHAISLYQLTAMFGCGPARRTALARRLVSNSVPITGNHLNESAQMAMCTPLAGSPSFSKKDSFCAATECKPFHDAWTIVYKKALGYLYSKRSVNHSCNAMHEVLVQALRRDEPCPSDYVSTF